MSDILQDQSLEEIGLSEGRSESPRLDQLLDRLGESSFSPFLILLSLPLALTQIGQSTVVSAVVGLCVIAMSVQMLLGWHHLHLPRVLRDLSIGNGFLKGSLRLMTAIVPDEERTRKQFGYWITLPPFGVIPKVIILLCGGLLPLSGGVYGLTNVLALAIMLLSIGLMTRQGLWVLVGASCVSLASILPALGG